MKEAILRSCVLLTLLALSVTVYSQSKKPAAAKSPKRSTVSKTGKAVAPKSNKTNKTAASKSKKPVAPKSTKPPAPKVAQPVPAKKAEPVAPPVQATIIAPPVKADESKQPYPDPFRRGTFSFINRTNVDYTNFRNGPYEHATTSALDARVDINYFFINHLAIGIDARYSRSTQVQGWTAKYDSWSAYLNITYGMSITPRLNIYARVGGGPGYSHSAQNIAAGGHAPLTELTGHSTDIYGTIALPVALEQGSPVFITPYFTYDQFKTRPSGHDITDNTFTFGFRLESYINSRESKKHGSGREWQSTQPKKGVSFFEINTLGTLRYSTRKEYQGSLRYGDVKRNASTFGIGYNYYFLDYLAAGLNIELSKNTTNNAGTTADKTTAWSVQPVITVNPPVKGALHNLFLQLGYGLERVSLFGNKNHNSNFGTRLGYNLFVTRNISLSPKIGYQRNVSDHITSRSGKYTDSGLAAELGIRAWLNFRWFQ